MKNHIYKLFLRMPRLLYGAALTFQLTFVYAQNVFAQQPDSLPGLNNNNPSASFVTGIICSAAFWMFYILIALTVVFVILAAYKYLTSSGDPEKVKNATKTITFAAVAVVVAIFARTFPYIIFSFFNTFGSTTSLSSAYTCY